MERIARGWAGLDLAVTGIMALPPTAQILLAVTHRLSGLAAPEPEPVRDFFMCLAGLLGVLWALARIRDPKRELILADTVGRIWVAGLILWFVGVQGAPVALLLFVVTEVAGALHQGLALRRHAPA